ncbi:MAG: hypothetical protein WA860_10540 [Acidimicrobiales bacterium]
MARATIASGPRMNTGQIGTFPELAKVASHQASEDGASTSNINRQKGARELRSPLMARA